MLKEEELVLDTINYVKVIRSALTYSADALNNRVQTEQ